MLRTVTMIVKVILALHVSTLLAFVRTVWKDRGGCIKTFSKGDKDLEKIKKSDNLEVMDQVPLNYLFNLQR